MSSLRFDSEMLVTIECQARLRPGSFQFEMIFDVVLKGTFRTVLR